MDVENKLNRDAPDLGQKAGDNRRGGPLTRRLAAELSPDHVDIPLLACCLCSGLTDSTLYNGKHLPSVREVAKANQLPCSIQHLRVNADW